MTKAVQQQHPPLPIKTWERQWDRRKLKGQETGVESSGTQSAALMEQIDMGYPNAGQSISQNNRYCLLGDGKVWLKSCYLRSYCSERVNMNSLQTKPTRVVENSRVKRGKV